MSSIRSRIQSPKTNSFTLIELLVVIAIIGLLAGVTVPTVAKALDKGKLSSDLGKARTWKEVALLVETEINSGDTNLSALTGTNATDLSKWYSGIVRAVGTNGALKLFSADTFKPTIFDTNTGPNVNPYYIYMCDETNGDVMLTTKNWKLPTSGNAPELSTAKPFGKAGAVLFFKNGGATIITPQMATNAVTNWGSVSNVMN